MGISLSKVFPVGIVQSFVRRNRGLRLAALWASATVLSFASRVVQGRSSSLPLPRAVAQSPGWGCGHYLFCAFRYYSKEHKWSQSTPLSELRLQYHQRLPSSFPCCFVCCALCKFTVPVWESSYRCTRCVNCFVANILLFPFNCPQGEVFVTGSQETPRHTVLPQLSESRQCQL